MLFAWCQTCQKVPDHWRWYAEPSRRATTIRVRCHGAEQEVSIAQEVLEDLRPIPEAIAVFDEWGRPHWRFLFEEDITLALSLSRLEWAAVTFRNALAEGAVGIGLVQQSLRRIGQAFRNYEYDFRAASLGNVPTRTQSEARQRANEAATLRRHNDDIQEAMTWRADHTGIEEPRGEDEGEVAANAADRMDAHVTEDDLREGEAERRWRLSQSAAAMSDQIDEVLRDNALSKSNPKLPRYRPR